MCVNTYGRMPFIIRARARNALVEADTHNSPFFIPPTHYLETHTYIKHIPTYIFIHQIK